MSHFRFKDIRLGSGLRTIIIPRTDVETVTLLALIGVGSRYETPRQAGLSHFLEHMFFKGTERRHTTKEIAEEIESVGGEFNAFTAEEYTGYYVKVASKYLPRAMDVVSDILLRPLFPPAEIERERGVIIEEIRMYTDQPMRHVGHLWNEAQFGQHPLGRRIDGSITTVNRFKQRDFRAYTNTHYHTGNAVVVVSGAAAVKGAADLVTTWFADLPRGRATVAPPAPKRQPVTRLRHETRPQLDQTHLIVGVPGLSLRHRDRFAAELLGTILGGGMSSRLFIAVRERRGLAYAIHTAVENMTDAGMVVTQAGVRTDQAPEALEVILAEYDRVMMERVSEPELTKEKQMVRGHMLIALEETNALALFAGIQALLTPRVVAPSHLLRQIEAVTARDVQRVARTLLAKPKRALALLGPQRSGTPFVKLLH